MDGARTRTLRRRLFRHLEVPLVLFQYIYIYIYIFIFICILEQNCIYIYKTADDNEVHYDSVDIYIFMYIEISSLSENIYSN